MGNLPPSTSTKQYKNDVRNEPLLTSMDEIKQHGARLSRFLIADFPQYKELPKLFDPEVETLYFVSTVDSTKVLRYEGLFPLLSVLESDAEVFCPDWYEFSEKCLKGGGGGMFWAVKKHKQTKE